MFKFMTFMTSKANYHNCRESKQEELTKLVYNSY